MENLLPALDPVIEREAPELAIIMVGTNDVSGQKGVPKGYEAGLKSIIEKCLKAGCIPVLNTIPPRRGHDEAVKAVNEVVKKLAGEFKVPLVDYYAEMMKISGGDWDGTVMHKDGIHPSNNTGKAQIFTEENMKQSGYALRTWLNFLMFREIYFKILSAPMPFVEKIDKIDPIASGIKCEVLADTEVGKYFDAKTNEQIWNWGGAEKIKIKGIEEFALFKFDMSNCKGMLIKKAILYLPRTEQCVIPVLGLSTISTDWEEGKGDGWLVPPALDKQGEKSKGAATFSYASYPDKTWTGLPGGDFLYVTFGEGGSNYGFAKTGWADSRENPNGKPEYSSVEIPLEVAQGLLVEGDSYGLCVSEEKGQRAFCKGYRRIPNPNHFVFTKESGKGAFLIVETEPGDKDAPAKISSPSSAPGKEAGELALKWTCPADNGGKGGKILGYDFYISKNKGDLESLPKEALLPRSKTARPVKPGEVQKFYLDGLEAGQEYHFAVVAYDLVGNRSEPVFFSGKTREARSISFEGLSKQEIQIGSPVQNEQIAVWACPSNSKVCPQTGLPQDDSEKDIRNGNIVWNGKKHEIELAAASNDCAGFQLVVEKIGDAPVSDLMIEMSDLTQDGGGNDAYLRMGTKEPKKFQEEMSKLVASDPGRAEKIFAELKKLNELRRLRDEEPFTFFKDMEKLKNDKRDDYDKWMSLIDPAEKKSGSAISSSDLEISWVWSVPDKKGQYYPDALLELDSPVEIPNAKNAVKNQKAQSFYLDLRVPRASKPGLYSGSIAVRTSQSEISVPVKLRVWSFELPDKLSFVPEMNGYGYMRENPDNVHEGVMNLYRLAHKNRLNPNIVPYSHNGNFTVPAYDKLSVEGSGSNLFIGNLDEFDKFYGPLLNGNAFASSPRKKLPITGIYLPFYEQWPCNFQKGYKLDQNADSLDIRNDFTKDYKEGWVNAANGFGKHLKDKGFAGPLYQVYLNNKFIFSDNLYWCLDEPMFRDDFLCLQMFSGMTRKAFSELEPPLDVDFRIDLSRVECARDYLNEVDILVMAQGNVRDYWPLVVDHMRKYVPKKNRKEQTLWIYGGTSKVEEAGMINRGFVLLAYFLGADGVLPWLAYGKKESWDSAEAAEYAVFYPGWEKWSVNGAFGSLRMKAFRDGQQDAEYLNILLAKSGGLSRKDLKDSLGKIVNLESYLKKVDDLDAGRVYFKSLNPSKLEEMRRMIAEKIDSMK